MPEASRVPLGIKVFYALGTSGEAIKTNAFVFLLIFYNQVLGLSGTAASVALAVALGFDAVLDPAIGSWSDGMRTRLGRRHTLMFWAIVPFCAFVFGLFWPPTGLTTTGLLIWLTVFTIGTRAAMATFNVPYLSLGAELTQNYRERTQITAMRTGVNILTGIATVQFVWLFAFHSKHGETTGQLVHANYLNVAFMVALSIGVLTLVSAFGTLKAIPHLAGSSQAPRPFSLLRVYRDIFEALGNTSFRALFVGTLVYFVYAGFQGTMGVHLATFFWKLAPEANAKIALAALPGALLGLVSVPWFNAKFDKKWTVVIGVVVSGSLSTAPVILRLFGWMPTDQEVLQVTLAVLGFLGAFIGVQASVSVGSMMGDIADEHELKHGRRQEGIYFGTYAFSQKCTTSLSTIMAGVAIDLIGLQPHADPNSVPQAVLNNFGWAYGLVALLLIIATWVFLPYSLTKRRHDEVLAALRARDASRAPVAALAAD